MKILRLGVGQVKEEGSLGKKEVSNIIPTFDVECREWVLPIAVGLYYKGEYREFLKISDAHDPIWEFLEYLRTNCKGIKLYAHSAATFDNRFILDSLTRHG